MKKFFYTIFMSIIFICCTFLAAACNSKEEPEPAAAPDPKPISGSFLQSWLCRDWTYSRWNQEFAAMKELGMDYMIIQSVYDGSFLQGKAEAQDWQSYTLNGYLGLYPSEIEELEGAILSSQNRGDALELALRAAKNNGMKVYIGLLSDDRWWDFGWGKPKLPSGKKDPVTESYFAAWCEYNGKLNGQMIHEIWNRYGKEYDEQIAGWYYYNEIWNIDVACRQTDGKAYATCIGNNINYFLDAINEACPDKPLMLSPFFNDTVSTARQNKQFWIDIFKVANFRAGDIFAPQDCVGGKNISIDELDSWIGGLKKAADTEEGLCFWVNNECFTPDYKPAEVSRLIEQIEATETYAEAHIIFSWNHYYNPLNAPAAKSYNNELKEYLKQRSESE